jgi:hypothetical protein
VSQKRIAMLFWPFVIFLGLVSRPASAQRLHTAPVVITGKQVANAARFPIATYRLFRTDASGLASVIPFQIDEINADHDYVLDQGKDTTANTGNGIFDLQDELSFMGDDVGPVVEPTRWPTVAPSIIYEVKISHPVANPMGPQMGAVYIGIYFSNPPPLSAKKYVVFNRNEALVHTSKYKYQFDQKNWLVARSVEVAKNSNANSKDPVEYEAVLDSTTFYMKGDLKYFVTVEANHRSIDSELEAWRTGPIRSIIRVSFFYRLLSLKIELGMYTEISFFSNAVYLPAVIYNPIDGHKSLNTGSGMYYGLALRDNPKDYNIETNMSAYEPNASALLQNGRNFFDRVLGKKQDTKATDGLYWISAQGQGRSIYMEITPSKDLQKDGVAPMWYHEEKTSKEMKDRSNDDVAPLGKSPVNLGVYFDVTKFSEGEHVMGFRLFFENVVAPERLAVFKGLGEWNYDARRVVIASPNTPEKKAP